MTESAERMRISTESPAAGTAKPSGHIRRLVHQLRTEGEGASRDGVAVGIGVLIGCLPIYGLHLAACVAAGWLLRLNRIKMYLAANISNPLMAPALVLLEIQLGALVRRGDLHALTIAAIRTTDPWTFGGDLVVGSVVAGSALGLLLGTATWLAMRSGDRDPAFTGLVRRAADRYLSTGITAWEFARGKMRGDPLYRAVLSSDLLPSGGVLVDVGCGQGLMLALLAEAARDQDRGAAARHLPVFDRLVGIETRPRVAAIARQALGEAATILTADARTAPLPRASAVLFFDVLHMLPAVDQEQLLGAASACLEPGGVILVREADAGAGWRFQTVRAGNRLKALLFGHWSQTFHFRSARAWTALFGAAGFQVEVRPAREGTPFGNVLFVLRPSA